jgi:putative SOS response-associated peptidase YedK
MTRSIRLSVPLLLRPQNQQRSLEVMRWGLVPFWAKDIKVGFAKAAQADGSDDSDPSKQEVPRSEGHHRC